MGSKKKLAAHHCGRCHKPLSNKTSIRAGYGPVCRRKLGMKGPYGEKSKDSYNLDSYIKKDEEV